MLYFLVRVIQMEVEEVKDLSLVHLAPADLVVLQLVPVTSRYTIVYYPLDYIIMNCKYLS